jgi:molybdate transport repressor ModE-like protein
MRGIHADIFAMQACICRSGSSRYILRHSRRIIVSPPRRALDYRVDPFDLQLFTAVAEHGTITAGAREMSLSLAAASERLKALEHRVGAKLLDRSKSGAAVTDAGRELARQAHRVLAELDSLHIEMAAFGRGLRGTVRLLCNTAAIAEALPPRLGRFLAEHPDIDVELQELSSDAVLQALWRGVADVGIVADYVDTGGLDVQRWIDDELVALLPARRKAQRVARVRFAHLLDRPFVGLSADSGLSRFLLQQAARSGRLPHHRVRVTSFDAVARIVGAGVGVAVMPRSAATRWRSASVQIAALKDAWARRTLLICCTGKARTLPGVRSLITTLMAE